MAAGIDASGLSLGWLLAIALGGGTLLFTAIGLVLIWWVKRRNRRNARMIYGGGTVRGRSGMAMPSSTRLAKRPLLLGSFSSDGRSSTSGLSSGLSLPPGLLPPLLPVYNGSTSSWLGSEAHQQSQSQPPQAQKSQKKNKSMSWTLDEDDLHGPKINKNAKDSWFERDSWVGLVPTLPDLGDEEQRMEEVKRQQQEQQQANVMLQREMHQGYEPPAKNEPMQSGGRQGRRPEQTHRRRASMVDINLKAILQSTELRLQHQRSRSQSVVEDSSKRMASSAREETLRSTRSSHPNLPSHSSSAHGWSSSPSKANQAATQSQLITGAPHKTRTTATATATTVSTDANATTSLIAVATQSLELPGGTSSPSKARANHWEQQFRNSTPVRPPKNPQRPSPRRQTLQHPYPRLLPHPPTASAPLRGSSPSPPPSPSSSPSLPASPASPASPRSPHSPQIPFPTLQHTDSFDLQHAELMEGRRSMDSDMSSTLSTLYSVNEPEEKLSMQGDMGDDPFVGGHPGQRPMTFTAALLSQKTMLHETLLLQPPRPFSMATHGGTEAFNSGVPLVIEPLTTAHLGNVQRHSQIMEPDAMSEVEPSEASYESVSVHDSDSDATVEAIIRDSPNPEWIPMSEGHVQRTRPSSAGTSTIGTLESQYSSSPYNEREVMNLLMAAGITPRHIRSLPPPMSVAGPDGSVVSLGLAPRPRSVAYSGLARQVSDSSSVYTTDTTVPSTPAVTEVGSLSTGSPQNRRPAAAVHDPDAPSVDNTVAELRRMNSLVSSYSAASLTSTIVTDADTTITPQGGAPSSGGKAITKPRSMIVYPSTETSSTAVAANRYQQYAGVSTNTSNNRNRPGNNNNHNGKPSPAPWVLRVNNNNKGPHHPATISPGPRTSLKAVPVLSPARRSQEQQPRILFESPGLYDKDGFLKDGLTEEQEKFQYSPLHGRGRGKVGVHSAAA